MILAIVGSRFFTDYEFVRKTVINTIKIRTITKIISGGAAGVDTIAKNIAIYYGIPFEEKKAKWKRPDGSKDMTAGMKRNIEIINASDVVIAFWDERTEHCGTYNDIQYCKKIGKICHVIKVEVKDET